VPPTNLLEAALYAVLGDARLPPFVRQHGFSWHGARPQRVDAYIPSWGRIVEADGRLHHARLADFERDRARDHAAQVHGIEITRFTYRQLMDRSYALDVLLAIQGQRARAA
jgi:very-short-patch-repair endonuclease